ncbi:3-deoxy-7-phosphoheptulonate synthase [Zhihengliuella halotolerans]|uniref:Phospho-2-dehydro-3-deoxyheptonate aldolase n=1 Tax=Zhihengliuella halotolerans TaxID=370736 RepID=A0A4Q8ADM2_9MICC|nr:3-deoxy-7-phosphoheptulonate synthase [Zhihengliuella halotolerans]RZU62347.1 3-deoxy-D-arabinoheptulosonate-7-phosphate synthase [Zhihengliuella halotolerans]
MTVTERGTATAEGSSHSTNNVRVSQFSPLPTPGEILAEMPAGDVLEYRIERARQEIRAILDGVDRRLLVVVGPCSIHDVDAGREYAARLAELAEKHREHLLIVMRTYFEKPRTTVGWKGLINDPELDGSHNIAAGLRAARQFLLDVGELGLPTATEFLEPISPQYVADLVSWGAIGARTTESQIHRQLVSGLSMPVGFKNGTDGGVQVAIDACQASAAPQAFLGIDDDGRASLVATRGNQDAHLILRGGSDGPNYSEQAVGAASAKMAAAGANPRVVVDASHANSGKDHERQSVVIGELAERIAAGDTEIAGLMAESFLEPGAQKFTPGQDDAADLVRGQSITDKCMGWGPTEDALQLLADAVARGR